MAAAPLYCVCRQPYDVSRFMIECDICKDWFHGSCVKVEEHQAVDIDVYHCPNCDVVHGPSLMKKRNNWHRHDYTEPDDGSKPVQAGTSVFVKELQNRTFVNGEEILMRMKGEVVTPRYLERHGFNYPMAVTEMEGLGLKLPPPTFSVKDVEQYVGGDKVVDVIDVARQADSKMKLSEFVKYFTKSHRPKVLNLISLEFSDSKMSQLVEVPDVAQKMSWVENYWPDDSFFPKPFVQKYCLMGVKDSYTDFHIDFGGTSVWYHVLWGEKVFYLIKPTLANLALYEAWSSSPNQSEVFFGDKVDTCYKCVVPQGTTLLIPTGWIHGVLTSQDCMAFGGNFLHNLNIDMQLRCYEMERRLKTPDLFKFPYFEAICWYVAKNLLEILKELREDNCPPPTYLVEGVKALISALKTWLKREVTEPNSEVPDHIRPNHLIKELTKEIRHLEEEPGSVGKPVKSQGSGCALMSGSNVCPPTRSTLERLCQARRARRAARRLREQQQKQQQQKQQQHEQRQQGHDLQQHEQQQQPGHEQQQQQQQQQQPGHEQQQQQQLQQHAPKGPSNLDILERHTREVLKRLEVGPLEEDPAFCAKVHGKLNKASTASSAAAAAESLEDNHLRLMLVNGRIIRDMRRPGSSPVKTEGERSSVGHSPPKSRVDVKTERRAQDGDERHERHERHRASPLRGVETVKTDLREDVSDVESHADSPTQRKASLSSSSSSDEDSQSSEDEDEDEDEDEEEEDDDDDDEEEGSGLDTEPDQSGQKLRHKHKPLKRDRPTSPSTQDAIQGMLSMAGLLCSSEPEKTGLSQESWWSGSSQREAGAAAPAPPAGSQEPDGQSGQQQQRGLGQSGAPQPPSPETEYQYCDPSMSPPLHPSKRHAPNPPPISNQATKGKRPKKEWLQPSRDWERS